MPTAISATEGPEKNAPCTSLTYQVNCRVQKSSSSEITIHQCCSHDEGTVEDPHAMRNFVLFANATKDADDLGDAGLVDQVLSKSCPERRQSRCTSDTPPESSRQYSEAFCRQVDAPMPPTCKVSYAVTRGKHSSQLINYRPPTYESYDRDGPVASQLLLYYIITRTTIAKI